MSKKLTEKNFQVIRDYIRKIAGFDKRILDYLTMKSESGNADLGLKKELEQIQRQLIFLSNRLMGAVTKNIMLLSDNWMDSINQVSETVGIDAKVFHGALYIRAPYPPHRFRETYTGLQQEIGLQINEQLQGLELYPKKLLYILNVYEPVNHADPRCFFDFDNFDYKSLIDEACRCYPGTDSPRTTKLLYASLFSGQLKPMTYLVITAQAERLALSDEALLHMLERVWLPEAYTIPETESFGKYGLNDTGSYAKGS